VVKLVVRAFKILPDRIKPLIDVSGELGDISGEFVKLVR